MGEPEAGGFYRCVSLGFKKSLNEMKDRPELGRLLPFRAKTTIVAPSNLELRCTDAGDVRQGETMILRQRHRLGRDSMSGFGRKIAASTLVVACFAGIVLPADDKSDSPAASTALEQCELYPLAVGTQWIYRSGPLVVRERVAGHEPVQGELCARIETMYEDKVVSLEHIAVRPDGLYRVAVSGKPVQPPLKFLSLPATPGTKWAVNSTIAGKSIRGEFVASEGSFLVRSPTGDDDRTFKTDRVSGEDFRAGSEKVSFTYDFVPHIGKVKQVAKTAGLETTIELTDFLTPGQAPTRTAGHSIRISR